MEFIAHFFGDYVLQNHAMATRKTSSWLWAAIHALFYGLPFLLLVESPAAWAVIVGSHALIDRYRLASYWVRFWGVGVPGWLPQKLGIDPGEAAPPYLATWLLIIVDNTMHLLINHLTLRWL